MIKVIPTKKDDEIQKYLKDNPVHHRWINGEETIIYTGDDIPKEPSAD